MLRLALLGGFDLSVDGQPKAESLTPRLQSFLAYLALHREKPQSRLHLAGIFWPDALEEQARNNLRQVVHQLRQALPAVDQYLQANTHQLMWRDDSEFVLDVSEFELAAQVALLKPDTGGNARKRLTLQRAVNLYVGDLLPSGYDDWLVPIRERLRQTFAILLKQLRELLEEQGDIAQAVVHAQRLLVLDPLDEDSVLNSMRLHALNNDRTSAMRVYQACADLLQEELGIEPNAALRECYTRLLNANPSTPRAMPKSLVLDVPAPLIGRKPEWIHMQTVWQRMVRGAAQMLVIAGEAGIGKTRLAEELMLWASQQGFGVAHTRAYAAEGRLAYAPVADWLRSDTLRAGIANLDAIWLSEVTRIVPELLTEHPDLPKLKPLTDETQRQRLFEALARAMLITKQPLLLVLDDLQWCDPDTLGWLRFLLRFDTSASVLVLGTFRSEEVDDKHPLMGVLRDVQHTNQLSQIELKRLDAAESAHLAEHILQRDMALSEATRLYRDTEGNPLFVVEMARAGLASQDADGQAGEPDVMIHLPARIQGVMRGRLAQLSPTALELARVGATIGRAFSLDVLIHASGSDEETVLRNLDELWQRRIVQAQDANSYDFTHDKLREVAYGQLSPAKRRLLHRRVVRAIEDVFANNLDSVSAQLAAQCQQADLVMQAVTYCLRAAKVARRIFASDQAWDFIQRGLSLLEKVNKDKNSLELEYELLTMQSTGFGAGPNNNATQQFTRIERIMRLGKQLGKPSNPSVLRALSTNNVIRAKYRESLDAGEQLLQLAEQTSDQVLKVEAYEAIGITHYWTGAFGLSRVFLEKSLALYESEQLSSHIDLFTWDPRIVSQSRLGLTLWSLGYPDQASQKLQSSQSFGESVGHPFSLGYSMGMNSLGQMMLIGDANAARKQAQVCLTLSQKHNSLVWWLHQSSVTLAWASAATHTTEETVGKYENSLQEFYAVSPTCMRTCYHTLLARLYAVLGRFDRSLTLLKDTQKLVDDTGERWYEPELHRTWGDVLLAQGALPIAAESVYKLAIEIAQAQQAKSFELRAATSLAHLFHKHGRSAEALSQLAPIYDWFTEGFETYDLLQARALLDQLSAL